MDKGNLNVKDFFGLDLDHPEPVPFQEQCTICNFTWDYSEDIKDCPGCGAKIV